MPANDLVMQATIASTSPRLVSGVRWFLAFLEQEKPGAVLQRESADAIFLLYEVATHSVIEECLPREIQAKRTFTFPVGRFT